MRVECERLGYTYGQGSPLEHRALSGISFTLGEGECLGILGGPGVGKTTLARNMAGIYVPTEGRLTVGGVRASGSRRDREAISSLVGYVPQDPGKQLFAPTVSEDVSAGLKKGRKRLPGWEEKVEAALSRAGLEPGAVLDRPVFSLSGGEARKVAVAGVLVLGRRVLVLDEPTSGLDAVSRRETLDLIQDLKGEGVTLVLISHRLTDLLPAADRFLVLDAGKQVYFGGLEELTSLEEAGSRAFRWPPHLELMRRLGAGARGIRAAAASPEEACREIRRLMKDS